VDRSRERIEAQIADIIRSHGSFLVCSHMNPDGDAVGSCVSLALFLMSEGKDVVVYNQSPIPVMYGFVRGVELIQQSIPSHKEFDVSFMLDCSNPDRVGEAFQEFAAKGIVICIDHHPVNGLPEGIHLITPRAAATGELLYAVFQTYGDCLTPEIATALYLALMTDTGSFQFSNTTAESLSIAAELMRAGADHRALVDHLNENYPPERFVLLGKVLQTLDLPLGGRVATLKVSRVMYDETGGNEDLTEGFVNIPRSIRGVEVALFFRESGPDEYRVSLRSRGAVNVGSLASKFQGGGHSNAAGCTLYGEEREVYETMIKAVSEALV
jgi:phosphoesterase RecJ-like protein